MTIWQGGTWRRGCCGDNSALVEKAVVGEELVGQNFSEKRSNEIFAG